MVGVYITLHVWYDLDEVPDRDKLMDLIEHMHEDANGEVYVNDLHYDYCGGILL